ncbi:nicotinate-nucleotide adenylyltransferase [Marinovum sp. 2_MG-2023]|uniref:nicotinate-nucleotide adenylyltransferase n=1 Tax=unclassified Marinovum TaxID=2647166 RepID=UPI0026E2CD35|nr:MULTISPECIES: nicotinate-nucleotide adenylyltransferase [unclassified Marinovum]MDO6730806.1 nicotinate-nucleotide adenylyltransferase [Marinovum sp. 2_MG-2023]MDO6779989.1 nicotinate-nucleotide adenylyltransferase [Marinovum sp. 1_MG-2023]
MPHFPAIRPGQTIGLLGGSFDPPHQGHVNITRQALTRFGLDRVWWLVSPGNPLKEHGPAPLDERMAAARKIMRHPRVDISDFEAEAGTRYTAETLKALIQEYRGTNFVWLMGADNLIQLPKWQDWQQIVNSVPIGVLARPGDRIRARNSKAARVYAGARIRGRDSQKLGLSQAPAWCFINVPMSNESSSAIRARGGWVQS